jgi:hypothetical protein
MSERIMLERDKLALTNVRVLVRSTQAFDSPGGCDSTPTPRAS